MARGLAHMLATKHTALARLVLPAAVAFGCAYTVSHGTNPLEDARAWVTGELLSLCDSVCGVWEPQRGLGRVVAQPHCERGWRGDAPPPPRAPVPSLPPATRLKS